MPELNPPKRISDHTPRLGMQPGKGLWLMTLAFIGAGAFTFAMAVGPWVPDRDLDAPRWVVAMIGIIFLAPGVMLAASMLSLRTKPVHNAPLWDRHRRWPRQYLRDDAPRDLRVHLMWAAGLILFLTPFNYFLWEKVSRGRWMSPEVLGIGLFDVVALIMLAHAVYKILRWLRHGRSRLEMHGFPLPLGSQISLRMLGPATLERGMSIQARLRAIESGWEESGSRTNRSQRAVSYCLYEEKQDIEILQPGEVHMHWQLPAGPETSLGSFPARYWELQLTASRPGIDYSSCFLLPVYQA